MDIKEELLTIIIVNWNTKELLKNCLKSIENTCSDLNYKLVVVDNASEDGSAEVVENKFPEVKLIRNDKNLGFAKANNQGIIKYPAEFFLFLNPDIIVHNNSIKNMIKFLIENKKVGGAGGKLIDEDGNLNIDNYYRKLPSLCQILFFYTRLREVSLKSKYLKRKFWFFINAEKNCSVEQVPACCLFVRKEALDKIGMFDENFYIWFEDVDLCYRMRRDGWKLYYLSEVLVTHYGGKSFELWNEEKKILRFYLSLFYYFKKNHNILKAYSIKIIILLNFILNILFSSVKQFLLPTPERNEYILFSKNLVKKLLTESSSSCING